MIILGDSHGGLFADQAPRWSPFREAFTARRFIEQWPEIWQELDPWIRSHRPSWAVVSVMEIDIRGHWWRHMPRHPEQSLADQTARRAEEFHQAVVRFADRYDLERVVIWGPPPATTQTTYNPDWPFVGPATTRNQLIDAYNHEMIARATNRIAYATAFYDYMDRDSWRPVGYTETDGVHYAPHLGPGFWSGLVLPAAAGFQQQSPGADAVDYCEHEPEVRGLYDTWMRTEDIRRPVVSRTTQVQGHSYTYMSIRDHWSQWPEHYRELGVKRARP